MTAAEVLPDGGAVLRDLGEHGTVEYTETPRRGYKLIGPDGKAKKLVSVTTVLGTLEKRALYRWHEARGAEGAIMAVRAGMLNPHTCEPSEAVEVVRDLKLGADAAKQQAADRGLDVHGALEHYCETGDLPPVSELVPDARPYLQGLAAWLLKYDPTPVHMERIVCHPTLLYAGRYDLLCEIGGLTALVDLKTSRSGHPYPEAHLQMEGYRAAESACGEPDPAQLVAVGVSPDGMFVHEPCLAPPGAFEDVLQVYRLRSGLDSAVRKARKEAAA